jgi:hypothetical protein
MGGLARSVGTIVVRSRIVRTRARIVYVESEGSLIKTTILDRERTQQRFIKVSHHGNKRERWRPFARHWWETNVGEIPAGENVIHKDGNPLNDSPSNLILASNSRFAILFGRSPEASKRRSQRQATAVKKSNTQRASAKAAILDEKAWYVVVSAPGLIFWVPYPTRLNAMRRYPIDSKGIEALQGSNWSPIIGADIPANSRPDGILEHFRRYIPGLDDGD